MREILDQIENHQYIKMVSEFSLSASAALYNEWVRNQIRAKLLTFRALSFVTYKESRSLTNENVQRNIKNIYKGISKLILIKNENSNLNCLPKKLKEMIICSASIDCIDSLKLTPEALQETMSIIKLFKG